MTAAAADRLRPFGTTIFSEMSRLAAERGAVNLGQGFPDFEGPEAIREAAADALRAGHNQYARSQGVPRLVEAVARQRQAQHQLRYDPMTEVGVYSGATEGITSAMLGLLNPGDEVIFFEPVYDCYPACAAMAGAVPRYLTLEHPEFALDEAQLRALITERTRLIVLNTPHNPTGKVFTRREMETLAEVAQEHDLRVITDEVYEHLVYDDAKHHALAALPGMRERTLSISSVGKTWSFTGWKVGWATGPSDMIRAVQAAHQFVTFATATPLQHGAAFALEEYSGTFLDTLAREYAERRDRLVSVLREVGFGVTAPQGAYFVLADFRPLFDGDDVAFAHHLIEEVGVAAIPPSFFYPARPEAGRHLIRFAFCKRLETLEAAAERLKKL
ncbi:MAG: aminotransferase class I/II-fold pyridoxal phosphate-dependent enzyme [Myxococcota bacterium]